MLVFFLNIFIFLKVEEWRHQSDDLQSELDSVQRESRMQAIEAHRLLTAQDSLQELVEGLRRENKQLSQEVHDLQVSRLALLQLRIKFKFIRNSKLIVKRL